MPWYAIEALDDAIEETRELLLPFDLGTWLRLALIVIFTGGGVGFVNPASFFPSSGFDDSSSYDYGSSYSSEPTITGPNTLPDNAITGVATDSPSLSNATIVLILFLIGGIFTLLFYISSVFEFIYYQSLLDKDVRIRKNFRKHWLNGLQYFVFKIAYLLVVGSLFFGLILGFIVNPLFGAFSLLIAIPLFILLAVFAGLIHDFVLLQMIESEEGLISGWQSIWPDLKAEWREVIVYLLVRFGLGIAIGIAVTIAAIALLIPFIIVFGLLGAIFGFIAEMLALIPLLTGIILFGIVLLGVNLTAQTFIYFFIVEVYHEITS